MAWKAAEKVPFMLCCCESVKCLKADMKAYIVIKASDDSYR